MATEDLPWSQTWEGCPRASGSREKETWALLPIGPPPEGGAVGVGGVLGTNEGRRLAD